MKLQIFIRMSQDGEIIPVSAMPWSIYVCITNIARKFEHSKTFGLVTSVSSNAVWSGDEDVSATIRRTGAGRAVVGANEEVLCWDVKKGELLNRWHDADCSAQVTAITQSKTDRDIFAVGYVTTGLLNMAHTFY